MQPRIVSVTPYEGSPLGGDLIRITGQNLGPQVAIYLGESQAKMINLQRDLHNADVVLNVRSGPGLPGLVDVHVQNFDRYGRMIAGESATLHQGFRYRRAYLGQEVSLTELIRELLRNIRERVLDNTSISASVEYSETLLGRHIEILPVAKLPALILSGPRLEENRFYSLNTTQDIAVESEIRRRSPPYTVDLIFSLIGASRSTKELLNLSTNTILWASRQRWITVQDRRWELDIKGRIETSVDRELRTFHTDIVVRGFDLDPGQTTNLTRQLQDDPVISVGDF